MDETISTALNSPMATNHLHQNVNVIVLVVCSLLFFCVADYGIDMRKLYPMWVISSFQEPWVRFVSYILIYVSACFNVYVATLLTLAVAYLHLDYINLVHIKPISSYASLQ